MCRTKTMCILIKKMEKKGVGTNKEKVMTERVRSEIHGSNEKRKKSISRKLIIDVYYGKPSTFYKMK